MLGPVIRWFSKTTPPTEHRNSIKSTFTRYLGRGWYGIEDDSAGTRVWSKNNAEIRITPDVRKVVLGFTTRYPQWTSSPQVIKVKRDDKDDFTVEVATQRAVLTVNCEHNHLISIHAPTLKPAEFEQSSDNRALGICLDQLIVDPSWIPAVVAEQEDLAPSKELNPNGTPGTVQVEITSVCNLKCKMCTNHAASNPKLRPLAAHMDGSVWEKLRPALRDVERLVFLGTGEVFTHPKFLPYLEEADRLGVPTVFSTNGQLLGRSIIDRLAALRNISSITVSVDSPDPEIYHRIRGKPLAPVMQGLREMGQRSALAEQVSVAATVMKSTLPSLAKLPRQLAEMGIHQLMLRGLFDYDFTLGEENPDYNQDDIAMLNRIKAECRALGIHLSLLPTIPAELVEVSQDDLHWALRAEAPQPWDGLLGPQTKQCFDPWEKAVITRDGCVYPCEVFGQVCGALGNLTSQDLDEIWRGDLFTEFRNDLVKGRQIGCLNCVRRQTGPHPLLHYAAQIVSEKCWSKQDAHHVTVRNTGALTWTKGIQLKIGTSARRDRMDSKYYHPTWLTPNRICTFSEERVAPGEEATFRFRVAPTEAGPPERFQLLFEGRLWLANTVFQLPFSK